MKILSWNVNSIRVRKNQLLSVIKKENPDITDAKIKYSMNKLKEYGVGAQIIKELKIKKMILVSRAKKRVIALKGYGIEIKKQEIIK